MTIASNLPAQLPSRDRPDTFDDDAEALFAALPGFATVVDQTAANLNSVAAGGAYAIPYTVDTSAVDADPGPGKLRFSSGAGAQNSSSTIRLDLVGSNGVDYTGILDTFDASTSVVKGAVRIVKASDPSKYLIFNVLARATPAGYRNITVTSIASSAASPFANGDAVMLFFQRTGDAGGSYPIFYVREEQAGGTASATAFTPAAWVRRVLNTTVTNTVSGASLASNQIILPAGTYDVEASAPAHKVDNHKVRLFNVTDNVTVAYGTSEWAGVPSGGTGTTTRSSIRGRLVLAGTKTLEVQHAGQTAGGSFGLSATFWQEVYTEIKFTKVA